MLLTNKKLSANHIVDPEQMLVHQDRFSTVNYFSGNQGLIFIGPTLVDEVLQFGYKLNQSKIPIYGYASQYFDAVADGKVLVNGFFTINYIDSGYMFAVMDKYISDGFTVESALEGMMEQTESVFNNTREMTEKLRQLARQIEENQNPWGTPDPELMKLVARNLNEDPSTKDSIISTLRRRFWGEGEFLTPPFSGNEVATKKQAEKIGREMLEWASEGSSYSVQRPDQLPKISITVCHGDPLNKVHSTYRVIHDVHILGVEHNISPVDEAQTETYSFIARSITF